MAYVFIGEKMKKIITILILLIPFNINAISASSYIVMDMDTNEVLDGQNIHNERLIASISKIMTCIVAIENGNLSETVKADEDILKMVGSSIYIEIGEQMTLNDLLYGMMLRSGNDAALMIAKSVSGSMQEFVLLMNKYAKKIGMKNTIFYNSHGLEEKDGKANKSTAYDMALLTSYAMQNKTFRKVFATKKFIAESNKKTYSWTNKNKLLKYDYINGGKTGYTLKAHRTLVTTGKINGINIAVVTLNAPDDWQDHLTLYDNVKGMYKGVNIVNKESFIKENNSIFKNYQLYINKNIKVTIKKKEEKYLKIAYHVKEHKHYNNNQEVGNITVYLNDKVLLTEPIYIQKIKRKSRIKNFFKKLFT